MSPPDWPGVEHRYHDLSTGVRAHVAHAGPQDAPPVLALHGFPQHWYEWRRVIDALPASSACSRWTRAGSAGRARRRTATIARRGSPRTPSRCSTRCGIERAILLGHDWGGWAGFIAVAHRSGALVGLRRDRHAAPVAAPGRAAAHRSRGRSTSRRSRRRSLGPRIIPRLVPTFLRVGWGDRSTYDDAAEEIYAATYREPARAEAASRYYRDFLTREALRDAPGRPTVPTKLLYGTREPLGRAGAEGFDDAAAARRLRPLRARGAPGGGRRGRAINTSP